MDGKNATSRKIGKYHGPGNKSPPNLGVASHLRAQYKAQVFSPSELTKEGSQQLTEQSFLCISATKRTIVSL